MIGALRAHWEFDKFKSHCREVVDSEGRLARLECVERILMPLKRQIRLLANLFDSDEIQTRFSGRKKEKYYFMNKSKELKSLIKYVYHRSTF